MFRIAWVLLVGAGMNGEHQLWQETVAYYTEDDCRYAQRVVRVQGKKSICTQIVKKVEDEQ